MNPHFYRLRKEAVGKDQLLGSATERCERDFLSLVLWVSKSNEIRERTLSSHEFYGCLTVVFGSALLSFSAFSTVARWSHSHNAGHNVGWL
jgi:hypothetical protein